MSEKLKNLGKKLKEMYERQPEIKVSILRFSKIEANPTPRPFQFMFEGNVFSGFIQRVDEKPRCIGKRGSCLQTTLPSWAKYFRSPMKHHLLEFYPNVFADLMLPNEGLPIIEGGDRNE